MFLVYQKEAGPGGRWRRCGSMQWWGERDTTTVVASRRRNYHSTAMPLSGIQRALPATPPSPRCCRLRPPTMRQPRRAHPPYLQDVIFVMYNGRTSVHPPSLYCASPLAYHVQSTYVFLKRSLTLFSSIFVRVQSCKLYVVYLPFVISPAEP